MASKRTIYSLIKGLVSVIPGSRYLQKLRGTRQSVDSSYYYGIWLKHLTFLWHHGSQKIPQTVAEFGPGDSLGVGIAALLSGASKYYALDLISYSNTDTNLRIYHDLVSFFKSRRARPLKGWPDFDQYLDQDLFPGQILTPDLLDQSLSPERLTRIEAAIRHPGQLFDDIIIKYIVPWTENQELNENSIDLCFSHSVLEYVNDLPELFSKIHFFLKPGGVMSHQIDLSGHNVSDIWNGHRGISEWAWKIIKGSRPYFLTRYPYSCYRTAIENLPFDITYECRNIRSDGLHREDLTSKWQHLSDLDLNCAGVLLQAQKNSPIY